MTEPGQIDFERVEEILASFSDSKLVALAKGPLPKDPTDEQCRACYVLDRMPQNAGAEQLRQWHDFVEKGYSLLAAAAEGDYKEEIEDALMKEITALMETLSYSRCMVIYFGARAELERRRRGYVEEGLDIMGEPPDERDARERRDDELAEDADRRLDAEKVGDL